MSSLETNGEVPKDQTEAQKTWQEYLQRCCEVGQLEHALEELDSQRRSIEKNLEVTKKAVKSLAHKHKENQSKGLVPVQLPPPPTEQTTTEAH